MDLYQEALEAAREEMESNLREQSKLEDRLREIKARSECLRQTIDSLSALLGADSQESGLTDAIREILLNDPRIAYTAPEIREQLRLRGFPIDEYAQPLSVIHTTLRRLVKQEEIITLEKDQTTSYRWFLPEVTDEDIPF